MPLNAAGAYVHVRYSVGGSPGSEEGCQFSSPTTPEGKQFVTHPKSQLVAMEMVVRLSRTNTLGTHISPKLGRGSYKVLLT